MRVTEGEWVKSIVCVENLDSGSQGRNPFGKDSVKVV